MNSELTIRLSATHRFSDRIVVNIDAIDGRSILKVEKNVNDLSVDLSKLKTGMYVIQLIDRIKKIKSQKIKIVKNN